MKISFLKIQFFEDEESSSCLHDRNVNGASGPLLVEVDVLKMMLLLQLKTPGFSGAQFNSQV